MNSFFLKTLITHSQHIAKPAHIHNSTFYNNIMHLYLCINTYGIVKTIFETIYVCMYECDKIIDFAP